MIRTYSELITIPTIYERYLYCKLDGRVGDETFGSYRAINQAFYTSDEWREFREEMLRRDRFCDLAHPDYEISGALYLHHLNPLLPEDLLMHSPACFDPENVVTVSFSMHQAITYGLPFPGVYNPPVQRKPNDTIPWR